ncbi:hypothetical protein EW146_g1471 [Bondarzewia mesenterica]|uniref:ferric-chelate reductase (NADPH) n=1 Tax=Bondarzewia mesenterica TaxID=1095465 RepID=A0A4S4M473_9AGAM|nr:hypothetical protein EW146_g1471 [Bondarzewia mesenterica]
MNIQLFWSHISYQSYQITQMSPSNLGNAYVPTLDKKAIQCLRLKGLLAASAAAASESAHLHAIKHRGEFEYPKQVWYLTLSALALATAINVVSIAWAWFRVHVRHRQNSTASTTGCSILRLPAAILTVSRIVAFRWRVRLGRVFSMSFFEVFITLVYMSALLIWEFVHTDNLNSDFWANKAAHIAAAQLPLLPALSAKNNIIGWLTGVGHERINVLHRAVARCILVLIWVHLWGRFHIGFFGADELSMFRWEQLGVAAGTTYTLAIVLSLRPVRELSHEMFYFTHVILVFVFILLAYLHTSEPGFGYYIWPTWVVWGFERLFRLTRYLILNVFLRPPQSKAALSLIASDALRITLKRRIPLEWRPGQHVFLAFPTISAVPLESHPFTIAGIPSADGKGEQELVFIVKGKEGLTKRLVERAAEKEGVKVPVYVDGPYGMPTDLRPYVTTENSVWVGGTGVSYTLPLLLDVVRRVRDGTALAKRIVFIWAIRDEEYLEWISAALADALSTAPPGLSLDIGIFVTGPSASGSGSGEKSPESVEVGGLGLVPVKGRPDVARLVQEEIRTAEGPMSVDVSGPPSLIRAVRECLASPVKATRAVMRGGPTIHFHAENFTL